MHKRTLISLALAATTAMTAQAAGRNAAPIQPTQSTLSSELTESECERVGGEVGMVGRRTCITRMQCTVVKPDGSKHTTCIDELE